MTRTQRVAAVVMCGVLLISGFAFGRVTKPATTGAESAPLATTPTTETAALSTSAPGQSHSFYLSDYNTGYNEGYESALKGVPNGQASTGRTGYNEGYKQGWAEGFQNVRGAETASYLPSERATNEQVPTRTRYIYRGNTRYVTRTVYSRRNHPSKLRTALTIAAPAALGAGIGGIAGGGKGAGVGALIGGGGGALYHLFKYRD